MMLTLFTDTLNQQCAVFKSCTFQTFQTFAVCNTSKMSLHKFWQACITAVCFVGFTIQTVSITFKYLNYGTTTVVSITPQTYITAPALTVCFKHGHIIDKDKISSILGPEYRKQLKSISPYSDQLVEYIQNRLSIAQLFEITPNIYVIRCRIRQPGSLHVETFNNAPTCHAHLEVTKRLIQNYICYKIRMKANDTFYFATAMRTMDYNGLIFKVVFDSSALNHTSYSWPLVHRSMYEGETSRIYATAMHAYPKGENFCRLSYARFGTKQLPKPYDTQCRVFSEHDRDCVKKCMIEKVVDDYGVVPFSEIYTEFDVNQSYGKLPMFDEKLLRNKADNNRINQHTFDCAAKCGHDCNYEAHTARISYAAPDPDLGGITYRLDMPFWPFTSIEYKPELVFNEYLMFVMSIGGTWLGFSVIQFNPFKIATARLCAKSISSPPIYNSPPYSVRRRRRVNFVNTRLRERQPKHSQPCMTNFLCVNAYSARPL